VQRHQSAGLAVTEADIAVIVRDGMLVTLKLAGPLLLVSLLSGLVVALVQAVTQINEATLSFIPKLLLIGVTLAFLAPFMVATLSNYTLMLFDRMVAIGGS
jgi:flagellar biosynthetic protein FliQ